MHEDNKDDNGDSPTVDKPPFKDIGFMQELKIDDPQTEYSLNSLFTMQDVLAKRIVERAKDRFPKEQEKQVNILCDAMLQEILELKNLTDWKYWKKFKGFDINAAREELIDALHFLIHLAIILDMTPGSFFEEYKKKWSINVLRQIKDY